MGQNIHPLAFRLGTHYTNNSRVLKYPWIPVTFLIYSSFSRKNNFFFNLQKTSTFKYLYIIHSNFINHT